MLLGGNRVVERRCYHECRVCHRGGFGVGVVVLARRREDRVGFRPPCASFFTGVRIGILWRMFPFGGILPPVLVNLRFDTDIAHSIVEHMVCILSCSFKRMGCPMVGVH